MDNLKLRTKSVAGIFLWLLFLIGSSTAMGDVTTLKVALITPEGSAWTNVLNEMAEEVERLSKGEVNFKIYPGGISGDELDVIRKMQAGRIHAAGFSGVGLGVLLPEIRILEAPLLFHDYGEVDRVKEKLYGEFAAGLEKRGYVLLGFAEAGFVYIFSKTDISAPDWIKTTRMWAWKGDPVAETFLKILGINTYPLHVTDVNTGLETGMIDSFYSPPLAAVAFQWHSKIRYILDYPVVNSTGALVMRKEQYDRLSENNKEILKTAAKKYCDKLIEITRRDNQQAISIMVESGIQRVSPSEDQKKQFKENAEKSYLKNIPDLYSEELLRRVQQILNEKH